MDKEPGFFFGSCNLIISKHIDNAIEAQSKQEANTINSRTLIVCPEDRVPSSFSVSN